MTRLMLLTTASLTRSLRVCMIKITPSFSVGTFQPSELGSTATFTSSEMPLHQGPPHEVGHLAMELLAIQYRDLVREDEYKTIGKSNCIPRSAPVITPPNYYFTVSSTISDRIRISIVLLT